MGAHGTSSAPWSDRHGLLLLLVDLTVLTTVLTLAPGTTGSTVALGTVLALLVLLLGDRYRARLRPSLRRDLPALTVASIAAGVAASTEWVGAVPTLPGPPARFLALAAVLLVVAALARGGVHALVRRVRAARPRRPLIVVGTGPTAARLVTALQGDHHLGVYPVGVLHHGDPDAGQTGEAASLPVPFLGGLGTLPWAMRDLAVHDVAFAPPEAPDDDVVSAVKRCLREDLRVLLAADRLELSAWARRRAGVRVGDVEMVEVTEWGLPPWQRLLRRSIDVVTAAVALVVLAPVFVVIAVALRLETHGSAWQHTHRTSHRGAPYSRHTFRTVRPPTFAEGSTVWRIDNSSRTGVLGSVVRRCRIHDLPRLLNVLAGDESLVGRPSERPRFVGENADREVPAPTVTDPDEPRRGAGRPARARAPR